ncbi:MAG: phosphopentomutase, partial [Candidatus Anammoxibacter sp.]
MTRAIIIVLDSVGVGALPDAVLYGDKGCNTLANIANALGGLHLPNLELLGLGKIVNIQGISGKVRPKAFFGKMAEASH